MNNLAFQLLAAANYIDALGGDSRSYRAAVQAAQPESVGEQVCGACNGSGRMVRDPDIGTDQECFVCDGSGKLTPEPMSAPTAEPEAWQVRHFFPEQGDTEWTDWQLVSKDNLFIWERRLKQMPDKYELRPLYATPPSAATEPSDAERLDCDACHGAGRTGDQYFDSEKTCWKCDGAGTIRATKGGKL